MAPLLLLVLLLQCSWPTNQEKAAPLYMFANAVDLRETFGTASGNVAF